MTLIEKIFDSRRIPRATYRLQFNEQFTFRDAIQIIPYLHQMGISDLYASPLLKARPGSTHGYDTCDYSQLNPVLGTEADFEDMTAALQQHNMGLLLDIVPNHMGVGAECNRWWMDVLEHGPSSIYAAYFDINWRPVKREMADRVLLPILEDHYGVVLEDGKLNLDYQDGAFCLFYGETRLPITPDTYPLILQPTLETVSAESETTLELQSILTALQYLPVYTDTEKSDERQRESQIIKRRLAVLMESAEVQTAVRQVVEKFNGVAGEAASFDMLDHLLNGQPYRLAFWRVAADEINYRRFFDINDMAAVQVEVPEVFAAVHDKILMLLANGQVTGLRIDHPDGLWHPAAYFRQIQESYLIRRIQAENPMEGVDTLVSEWADSYEQQPGAVWPVYIVAEKILSETEPLPHEWAVNGTTGYDFLNLVNGLFVQPERAARFTEIYERFVDHPVHFDELVYEAKHLIMDQALSSEIRTLSHRLERITESSRRYRDFTLTGIRGALREVIASMSIYRTYITAPETISDRDRRYLIEAVLNARRRNPDESRLLFSFIRDTLLLNNLDNFPQEARTRLLNFVMKFQQLTGPVMAKSFEDTTFYIYNRLVSLNEVGGHPQEFGISLEHFHQQTQERAKDWPHSLLASSTHDTKRSEDVRARLNVLSEIPDLWEAAVQRWSKQNAPKKRNGQPDANDEYLFYQVLLGIWGEDNPEDIQARLTMYMIKAANEAKVYTSWINPNDDYTGALQNFVADVFQDAAFLEDVRQFFPLVDYYGRLNSLAQTLLKLTAPGVPDIYQGTELWDFSLVDPDNRRPVDFEKRQQILNQEAVWSADFIESDAEGVSKAHIIKAVLNFRRQNPALFEKGTYEPLEVSDPQHLCAFARRWEGQEMVVIVPRLMATLMSGRQQMPVGEVVWGERQIQMPAGRYHHLFTGEVVEQTPLPVGTALRQFPLAVFIRE